MKCPNCGAEGKGKFCEYCGCEMPKDGPDTVNLDASSNTTVINNYYSAPTQLGTTANTYNTQQRFVPVQSTKNKTTALILCILLGYFGVHQFYAGKAGMGILYLFTMGLFGIGWIIDIIMIATGSFKDNLGLPIK